MINCLNRKKNVNDILGRKLKSSCETRWLSQLECLRDMESNLEAIYYSKFDLTPLMDENDKKEFNFIYQNRNTLHFLIEILSLFEFPIIEAQSSSKPTLHRVWPTLITIALKLFNYG